SAKVGAGVAVVTDAAYSAGAGPLRRGREKRMPYHSGLSLAQRFGEGGRGDGGATTSARHGGPARAASKARASWAPSSGEAAGPNASRYSWVISTATCGWWQRPGPGRPARRNAARRQATSRPVRRRKCAVNR